LVRLRSHPLADAPTSVASSGNSRRNSNEQQPQRPTVHAALPVGGASGPAAAGVGSTVVGDAVSGAAGAAVAASNAAGNQAAATQGAVSERGGAGFAGAAHGHSLLGQARALSRNCTKTLCCEEALLVFAGQLCLSCLVCGAALTTYPQNHLQMGASDGSGY
jgi:hypothetical protein